MDNRHRGQVLADAGHAAHELMDEHGEERFERGCRAWIERTQSRKAAQKRRHELCDSLARTYTQRPCDRHERPDPAMVWDRWVVLQGDGKSGRGVQGWYPLDPAKGSLWHALNLETAAVLDRCYALLGVAMMIAGLPSPYRRVLETMLKERGEEPLAVDEMGTLAMELLLELRGDTSDLVTAAALEAALARVRRDLQRTCPMPVAHAPEAASPSASASAGSPLTRRLMPCEAMAYEAHNHAIERYSQLVDESDRDLWQWLVEHGGPDGYRPPAFDTFVRYVRAGRKAHGTGKYKRRQAPLQSRSLVQADSV